MKANLAVVWFSPEYKGGGGSRQSDGARRPGNGHPRPSSILIVEDDVLVRMSVADHLRECGYRVIEAGSGYEAQRIMKGGAPVELLFSDIDLGVGMNGIGLATWVRQEYPAVRILLASGATQLAQ